MESDYDKAVLAYVRRILREKDISATQLAKRIGVSNTTLTRPLNNPDHTFSLSSKTLRKLYEYSGIEPPMVIGHTRPIREANSSSRSASDDRLPLDLPVLGLETALRGRVMVNARAPVAYVERPWFLLGRPDAYSVYMPDKTMEPAFGVGHLIYIDPSRPPSVGDDVAVRLEDDEFLIRRLSKNTDDKIVLEQHSPSKTTVIDRARLKALHLVVASLRVKA